MQALQRQLSSETAEAERLRQTVAGLEEEMFIVRGVSCIWAAGGECGWHRDGEPLRQRCQRRVGLPPPRRGAGRRMRRPACPGVESHACLKNVAFGLKPVSRA